MIECLAALELENCRLQMLKHLIVVPFSRRDRRVSEQGANLDERADAFGLRGTVG